MQREEGKLEEHPDNIHHQEPEGCSLDSVDAIDMNLEITQYNSSSSLSCGDSHLDGLCIENQMAEEPTELVFDLDTVPRESGSPLTSHSQGIEPFQPFVPSGMQFLVSNREQGRNGGYAVRLNMVTISSSIPFDASSETATPDVGRNDMRLSWDAFATRGYQSRLEASAIAFTAANTYDQRAQTRWLLGFRDGTFDDSMNNDSRYHAGRIHRMAEPRRHSNFEIWETLRGVLDDDLRRSSLCPSGLHPDGSCSCQSLSMTVESSARESISRIIIIAEALFEVLDEIHRHLPTTLLFSAVCLTAPESVVDSFPVKNHTKVDNLDGGDDIKQCYICLSEYEEGEKIRILPCHHEYHMSCVDKWLKEIHGVCPLCRGDVCEGVDESSRIILA